MFDFFKNKKILITGHTGFKGSWLTMWLSYLGADVFGYSLAAEEESLFNQANIVSYCRSNIGDIRNIDNLKKVFDSFKPEIVFHLAAQPLVRLSYKKPIETYETNVMGTVNILECVRKSPSVKSFLNFMNNYNS